MQLATLSRPTTKLTNCAPSACVTRTTAFVPNARCAAFVATLFATMRKATLATAPKRSELVRWIPHESDWCEWHFWFAWHPVTFTDSRERAWFETVQRKLEPHRMGADWIYRPAYRELTESGN